MQSGNPSSPKRYQAVCCDLLSALIDSWSLWEAVAGDGALGSRWRSASLRLITAASTYRAYESIVAQAAAEVGLEPERVDRLLESWPALRPYPDVGPALRRLGLPVTVLTNTSHRLAEVAAAALDVPLRAVVSAQASGWYKPRPEAYAAGWRAAGTSSAADCLFIAGSAHDVAGAARAGHDVFWVRRRPADLPAGAPPPRWQADSLDALVALVGT
ncbi:MAG: HAD-IA family hydrolase [Candidatus Dormibacteria bacterium]